MEDEIYPNDLTLIFRFAPAERAESEARYQDVAEEYAILELPQSVSGLIVYGRFGDRWVANPWGGARPVIRYLLDQLKIFGWDGPKDLNTNAPQATTKAQ